MVFELDNHEVLSVVEEVTQNQTAIVKKHHCMLKKILVTAEKTLLGIDEQLTINFEWQIFDLSLGEYVPNSTDEEITFQINSLPLETLSPVNGTDTLTFSAAEPGTYTIKSTNPLVDNGVLEVVVSA